MPPGLSIRDCLPSVSLPRNVLGYTYASLFASDRGLWICVISVSALSHAIAQSIGTTGSLVSRKPRLPTLVPVDTILFLRRSSSKCKLGANTPELTKSFSYKLITESDQANFG